MSVNRSNPGAESSVKAYDSALRKRQKTLSVVFLVMIYQHMLALLRSEFKWF